MVRGKAKQSKSLPAWVQAIQRESATLPLTLLALSSSCWIANRANHGHLGSDWPGCETSGNSAPRTGRGSLQVPVRPARVSGGGGQCSVTHVPKEGELAVDSIITSCESRLQCNICQPSANSNLILCFPSPSRWTHAPRATS